MSKKKSLNPAETFARVFRKIKGKEIEATDDKRRSINHRAAETFAKVYQEVSGKKAKVVGESVVEVDGGLRCRICVK